MLFQVTATHTTEDCGAYDMELQKRVGEWWAGSGELGEKLGVKVRYWTLDAPGHTFFILLEAESSTGLSKFLMSNPMRQTFDIRPVIGAEDMKKVVGNIGPEAD